MQSINFFDLRRESSVEVVSHAPESKNSDTRHLRSNLIHVPYLASLSTKSQSGETIELAVGSGSR